jgi:transcriptional regulator with XRE-family HTH domain
MPRERATVFMRYVAANVRRARRREALTQEGLAELTGFEARYVQRIERGTENLSIESLARLAEVLATTPSALLRPAKLAPPKPGRPKTNRPSRLR